MSIRRVGRPRVVVVDHHDSYTFNLVHLVAAVTGELPAVVDHHEVTAPDLAGFSHVVLSPGPGHPSVVADFDVGRALLRQASVPVLGVCLGMHLLADASDEGSLPGLGLVAGVARRLDVGPDRPPKRIPHVGWAELAGRGDPLLDGIDEPRFYFSHSYGFDAHAGADVVATATYGRPFPAIVRHGRVWGAQFHPEKSGRNGMRFLRNFLAST